MVSLMKKAVVFFILSYLLETIAAQPVISFSGSLPVMYITTESAVDSKDVYVRGTFYIDALGLEGYESCGSADTPLPLQIKGRGNWTWNNFEKKPYRLKFDKEANPLGMNSNRHFVLLANADDDLGFLRNTVGFELSRMLGLRYTPSQQPVELVLNGEYIGLYMLAEKVRVDKNRVNIEKQADNETNLYKMTGGWLLEIDNYVNENQIVIPESNGDVLCFTIDTPEMMSEQQRNYMTDFLVATDHAIYNSDKNSTDWENYIDLDELVRFYIVQEVMDDVESFRGSCFMYKERGENTKLKFGPVWDFGNSLRRYFDKFIYIDAEFGQNWIGEIAKFPRFQERVREIWNSFLTGKYPHLESFVDDFIDQISSAAVSDGARWPKYSQSNIYTKRNSFKYRIGQKVDYLKQQWGDGSNYVRSVHVAHDKPWYIINGIRVNSISTENRIYIHDGKTVICQDWQ